MAAKKRRLAVPAWAQSSLTEKGRRTVDLDDKSTDIFGGGVADNLGKRGMGALLTGGIAAAKASEGVRGYISRAAKKRANKKGR